MGREIHDSRNYITHEIARSYYHKAQNTGGRFENLKKELMKKYGVTEIEAINILNGYHISDYVHKYKILSGNIVQTADINKKKENRELILKIAELEDELKKLVMENENI